MTLCLICMDETNDVEEVHTNKCSHKFHIQCLLQWAQIQNTCPLCREQFNEICTKTDSIMIADAEQNNSESWITDDVKENENDEVITNFVSASQLQICSACYFIIDYRIEVLQNCSQCGDPHHSTCLVRRSSDPLICNSCWQLNNLCKDLPLDYETSQITQPPEVLQSSQIEQSQLIEITISDISNDSSTREADVTRRRRRRRRRRIQLNDEQEHELGPPRRRRRRR